jgi:hypothetical protein
LAWLPLKDDSRQKSVAKDEDRLRRVGIWGYRKVKGILEVLEV